MNHSIATAAACVAAIALLAGCSQPRTVSATSGAAPPPTVAVAPVTRQDLARSLELAAEFRPYQEIDLDAMKKGKSS